MAANVVYGQSPLEKTSRKNDTVVRDTVTNVRRILNHECAIKFHSRKLLRLVICPDDNLWHVLIFFLDICRRKQLLK